MKRLVAIVLLAGLTPPPAVRAADYHPGTPIPTAPSVPAPVLEKGGMVLPASGVSRVIVPVRERVAPRHADTSLPLPTGYQPPAAGAVVAAGDCAAGDCGPARNRGACVDRLKAWLCFQPTTGDALPKFRPHPYVGPITGTFPCTSGTGACGGANGCATGNGGATADGCRAGVGGRLGGLLSGCGGRGGCVPPGDDAFPGYHFAGNRPPAAAGLVAQPVQVAPPGYTTYKPAAAQPSTSYKPAVAPPAPVPPREPQSRAPASPGAAAAVMPASAQVSQPAEKANMRSIRWASWPNATPR